MARILPAILLTVACLAVAATAQTAPSFTLAVTGMTAEDVPAIQAALRELPGVQQTHVDLRAGRVWVWTAPASAALDSRGLIDAIEGLPGAAGRIKASLDRSRVHPLGPGDVNVRTGPALGAVIPPFTAVDQQGKPRRFEDLRGPKGLVLLFYRSADW